MTTYPVVLVGPPRSRMDRSVSVLPALRGVGLAPRVAARAARHDHPRSTARPGGALSRSPPASFTSSTPTPPCALRGAARLVRPAAPVVPTAAAARSSPTPSARWRAIRLTLPPSYGWVDRRPRVGARPALPWDRAAERLSPVGSAAYPTILVQCQRLLHLLRCAGALDVTAFRSMVASERRDVDRRMSFAIASSAST